MASSSIPMTRLGDRSFNHQSSSDAEAEYDRLRDLARKEAAQRASCFDRSHAAYQSGDGAAAKQLSAEGKKHAARMEQYNRQASEFIFRENNAPGRVAADTIDLHGQFVDEAERILTERIRAAQAQGQTHLHVIVGRGNHSVGHVQKIKPAVETLCRELGLQFATEENEGRIYVNLQGGAVPGGVAPALPQQPAGHLGGYHGGGHSGNNYGNNHNNNHNNANTGYQSHPQANAHYQGNNNNNNNNNNNDQLEQEIEKLAVKCLPKLFKQCCTIM